MLPHILIILRFTLLEAYRTRLPLLAAMVFSAVGAGSLFIHQIAVTESARLQWSFYASGSRAASVLVIALYITSSTAREFNEKGLELLLALDLPRAGYLLGKLAGFASVAVMLGLMCGLPMLFHAPVAVVAIWTASLVCELAIVAALALFCIVTLRHVLPAVMLILGLYVLGRTITAMRLMSETDLLGSLGGARPVVNFGVDLLAYVVPALDRNAVTTWIADRSADTAVLGPIALQSLTAVALLTAAALYDFYRREI